MNSKTEWYYLGEYVTRIFDYSKYAIGSRQALIVDRKIWSF